MENKHGPENSAYRCVAAWMGGELGEEWIMCMRSWVPSLCTWNYHNIASWLVANTKQKVF